MIIKPCVLSYLKALRDNGQVNEAQEIILGFCRQLWPMSENIQ